MQQPRLKLFSSISPRWRRVVILLCSAGAIGGLGCATMFASQKTDQWAAARKNKPAFTDTVFAIARADENLARKMGCDNAVALLGKRHTYMLVEGGDILLRVAADLDGNKVVIEESPRAMLAQDKSIWGSVALRYKAETASPQGPPAEHEKLLAMGFTADRNGNYRRSIPVKGVIYPPTKVSEEVSGHFKQTRTVAFHNPLPSEPMPDFPKMVIVPLAVAVDIALVPVYAFGLLILVIGAG